MNPDPLARNPLAWNPFAVLGLPEWPDLDDETVHAAWQAIAAETHPDRDDGGNLARYTQATAAYNDLSCPWGRSEAFADLLEAAWADGRYDAYPGHYPPGHDPADDEPLGPGPWEVELGPVPWSEVVHLVAEIPARFRRGHPVHLLIRAAVIAGLCLAVLALFPGRPAAGFSVVVLIGVFVLSAREDMAPPARPVRRLPPAGKKLDASGGASGSRMDQARTRLSRRRWLGSWACPSLFRRPWRVWHTARLHSRSFFQWGAPP